jgi:replication factor C subunit 2/4
MSEVVEVDGDVGDGDVDAAAELAQLRMDLMGTFEAKESKGGRVERVPWLEKYRPQSVDDVVHQQPVVSVLKRTLESGMMPNLLFYGPPGTGKTTLILALAKQLFGVSRRQVLELNASAERGIDVIREKVKLFAKLQSNKFKIVILDEADSMTRDAQSALRRIMETHVHVTRFCLIANYISRIIDPIVSRTVHFRFQPLPPLAIVPRLNHIVREEKVDIDEKALDQISRLANGDMRLAISTLHMAHNVATEKIDTKLIEEVTGTLPSGFAQDLFKTFAKQTFDDCQRMAKDIIYNAYPPILVLEQIALYICDPTVDSMLPDTARATIANAIATTETRLLDGADEELQITALFSTISRAIA